MVKITETEVTGWRHAIRGMRNALESWDKSDSVQGCSGFKIGENDLALMKKLVKAGDDHAKFMRYITVYCDCLGPWFWWKEYDTYKIGTVANSCSTMHTIHKRDLTADDFSCEDNLFWGNLNHTIDAINYARKMYLETKDKQWWYSMIQLLPSSFNQKRTLMLNYQVLRHIYHARKNHKLKEWHIFCDWIRSLPYSELITGEEN